jgi:predicted alpha/beta hydrolase
MKKVPFESEDKSSAHYRLFESNGLHKLIIVPAMGVAARAYDALAEQLVSHGISVLAIEHRGGPGSSFQVGPKTDAGYAEIVADVKAARNYFPKSKHVHFLGHSMGAQVLVAGAAQFLEPDNKLVVVAGGTVHWRSFKFPQKYGVYVGTQSAKWLTQIMGYFPGHKVGFGGLQPKQLILDWAQASKKGVFFAKGKSLEIGLETVRNQVLALHVEGDTMAPKSALKSLVEKLVHAEVSIETVLPPLTPKKMNAHFRWLKNPQFIADRIASFVKT